MNFSGTEAVWAAFQKLIMTIMPLAPFHRQQLNVYILQIKIEQTGDFFR